MQLYYEGQLEACVPFYHILGCVVCIFFCFNAIRLKASVSFNHSPGWGFVLDDWGLGFIVYGL